MDDKIFTDYTIDSSIDQVVLNYLDKLSNSITPNLSIEEHNAIYKEITNIQFEFYLCNIFRIQSPDENYIRINHTPIPDDRKRQIILDQLSYLMNKLCNPTQS